VKTVRRLKDSPWPAVGVFITSVLVTILFWTILPSSFVINENSDYTAFYEPVARNILNGSGFVSRDGSPAIRVAPGYPVLLAATFKIAHLLEVPEQTILSIFTLFSMGLASVFIFMLAQSVWGLFPGLVSAVVWITYPLALWLTKQTNSEIPFLPVFYGGFYLFWYALCHKSHWSIYFLSGLIIGFAMLVRPIAIWAVLVMGTILWLVVSKIKSSFKLCLIMIMLLGNLVAIFPWEMWLYTRTGKVVPLRKASLKDSLTFAVNPKGYRRGVKVPQDVEVLMRSVMGRKHELRSPKGILSIMVEQLRTRPLAVVKLLAIKAVRSWYGTDSNRFENQILMLQIPYLVLILWGSRAAWKQGGIAKELAISVWLMTLYFWAMTIVAFSIVRYMVPAVGLLFVLVPGAFAKIGKLTLADSGIASR
jgi:hypothetical protein